MHTGQEFFAKPLFCTAVLPPNISLIVNRGLQEPDELMQSDTSK